MATKPKKTTKYIAKPVVMTNVPQSNDLTLTQAKALVKFAKEQGIKKLSYNGLVIEFEHELSEPEVPGYDYTLAGDIDESLERESPEDIHKKMRIEVQELLLDTNEQDKPKVEIDETDMWGV